MVSKMLVAGSNRRIFGINKTLGGVITGLPADGRQIINRAREESTSYKETYGHSIVPSVLANRLGLYTHFYTLHYSLRPFGKSISELCISERVSQSDSCRSLLIICFLLFRQLTCINIFYT